MTRRFIASAIATVTMCGLLFSGCGQSNEAGLKGESKAVPQKPDLPNFTNYSEVSQYTMQKAQEQMKKGVKKAQ
jgi:curli biogenesis system outer membrane secretion channel CsgG